MKNKIWSRTVVLALAVALLSHTGSAPASSVAALPAVEPLGGKLVIIGGAIKGNSVAIHTAITSAIPEDAIIGIVPTATEEPEASIAATTKRLTPCLRGTQKLVTIPLFAGDVTKGDDEAIAAQIRSCHALFFLGGEQDRILNVFRPSGRRTKASDAIDALLAKGGVVSGSSAGAAMMSNPMLNGGTSARALGPTTQKTTQPSVPLTEGFGFFPYGLVDQHFLERGRLGRLLVALEHTNLPHGFGIPEDRALLVNRATGQLEVLGIEGLLLLDRTKAESSKGVRIANRTNLRISLLSTGDTLDGPTAAITVSASRPRLKHAREGAAPARTGPWEERTIAELIETLAGSQLATASASDGKWEVRITADGESDFYAAEGDPKSFSATNLRLDVLYVPSIGK